MSCRTVKIDSMIGKTLRSIDVEHDEGGLRFTTTDDEVYLLHHHQDCCENVSLEDTCGELSDLLWTPLTQAEEVNSDDTPEDPQNKMGYESYTYTFYKFATIQGYVTLRFLGTSSGYYSEGVDFCQEV